MTICIVVRAVVVAAADALVVDILFDVQSESSFQQDCLYARYNVLIRN